MVLNKQQTTKNGSLLEGPLDGHKQYISKGVYSNKEDGNLMHEVIHGFAHWFIKRYDSKLMLGNLNSFGGVLTDVTFISPWRDQSDVIIHLHKVTRI